MEDQLSDLTVAVRENILDNLTEFKIRPRTDDAFLAKFIRTRKYDPVAAYLSIQKYYKSIHDNLDRMAGLSASDFGKVYDLKILRILKHQFNGAFISYWDVKNWDTRVASFGDLNGMSVFLSEEVLQIPQFQIHGIHPIVDASHFTFSHVRQLTYGEIHFAIELMMQRFPIRVGGIHVVNYPRIFWPFLKLIISFLPKKLKDRIHLHNNYESLASFFSPEILPKSAGGTLEDEEAWNNEIIAKLQNSTLPYDCYWKSDSAEMG